jgi:hypothetical protein
VSCRSRAGVAERLRKRPAFVHRWQTTAISGHCGTRCMAANTANLLTIQQRKMNSKVC